MQKELFDLYQKHHLSPVVLGSDICLSFSTTQGVAMIVRSVESATALSVVQVEKHLKKIKEVGRKIGCDQFRIVCSVGFAADCYAKFEFSVALGDERYLRSLRSDYHLELFAHNENTYSKIIDGFQTSQRVAVVQATGTGKSLLIARLVLERLDQKFLVFAPSHYIINEIKTHLPKPIAQQTTFMSYMLLARMAPEKRKALEADYVVLDEFHRCGAIEWGAGICKLLSEQPNAKVLGTSATPIRYLDAGRDMAQELFDGCVVQNLSLAKAIAEGILPTPKYITAIYDIEPICKQIKKKIDFRRPKNKELYLQQIKQLRERWNNGVGVPLILKKHLLPDTQKVLVFCKNIKQLQKIRSIVHQWFLTIYSCKVNLYELHSEFRQKSVFEEFERPKNNEIDVLLSVNMLSEGIHTKGIDAVVMLRDTMSTNIYLQQLGRCLTVQRKTEPVVFDLVNNLDGVAVDKLTGEYNTAIWWSTKLGKEREALDFKFVVIDEMRNLTQMYRVLMDNLEKWELKYEALRRFYQANGHSRATKEMDLELRYWCTNQKREQRLGRLSVERKAQLDALSFVWKHDPELEWINRFEELANFYRQNGHCNVSEKKDPLAIWCNNQRIKQRIQALSPTQIERLNEIEFEWEPKSDRWDRHYKELVVFYNKNGHSRVPWDMRSLNNWYVRQRDLRKKGVLSEVRITLLDRLDFKWEVFDAAWEERYLELVAFKHKRGHCMPPMRLDPPLARWVFTQRSELKAGRIALERKERLDQIGFVWDPERYHWKQKCEKMKQHLRQTKRTKPLVKEEELYRWYKQQKKDYLKGRIAQDRVKLLQAIHLDIF